MSKDKPNGQYTRVELEMAVDQMVDLLPAQLRAYSVHAQALKAKYDALVKEGFSEAAALEIVKSRPIYE